MARSKRSQSKHDSQVRSIARKLEKQGYNVKADIKGYPKPNTIGGYRPDVVATKGGSRKIYEVETVDSKDTARDLSQQKEFRKAAARSNDTTFKRTIVR
jgi:hypothetical protein